MNEKTERARTYQEQIIAINFLISNKRSDNIPYLIPFLAYVSNVGYLLYDDNHPKTLEEIKAKYPVFGAMFTIPGAGASLTDYCLDDRNPNDYRLTAFGALKFVDNKEFNSISSNMNNKWNRSDIKNILTTIENEDLPFTGMISVESDHQAK